MPTWLVELAPSRWDDEPARRMQAALAGLGEVREVALELAVEPGRLRFFVRAADADALDRVRRQVQAHHPQARVTPIERTTRPADDPLRCGPQEHARGWALRLVRPSAFPLAGAISPTSHAGRPTQAGPRRVGSSGDLLAGLGAVATDLPPDARVVVQLVLAPAPGAWGARPAMHASEGRPLRPSSPPMVRGAGSGDVLPLVAALGLGGLGLRAWLWYRDGDLVPVLGLAAGVAIVLPVVAAVTARFIGREQPPAELVREKLTSPVFVAHLRVVALGPRDAAGLHAVAGRVAAALTAVDHPAGNRLQPRPWRGDPLALALAHGPLHRRDVLTAAEIAALWHLPPALGAAAPAERSRRLAPAAAAFRRGGRVGVTSAHGTSRAIHLPPGLLARHHLIVAKTRRGKSTLLVHLAHAALAHLAGGERLTLVVIDPHQDLAEAVLGLVPAGLEERVIYLNLADREHPVGLNLLDPELFPDRDRTAEHLVAMLHRLWPDNWGPRMEGALRAALMALHEANQGRPPEHRYTLLDVTPFLATRGFREEVLAQVRDLALHAWWNETYTLLPRVLQQQIANPVTTKIGRFLVGEASRLVIGQPRSTLDPRRLLAEGGALVVNAAAGRLGEGGAALLGATVLNLVGLLVEEQVALAPERRTRVVALVDEASTLAAADYPRMLSEFGKYGLSVVLVTQSLAKLDAIDRHLRPTVLANVDALTVFGVSAEDARLLSPELGPELAPEDLTDLDDYTCYARWWEDGHRPAPFSFRVDAPPPADRARMADIATRSAMRVGRPRKEVLRELEATLRDRQDGRLPTGQRHVAESDADEAGDTDADVRTTGVTQATTLPHPTVTGAEQSQFWGEPAPPSQTRRRSHARSNAARRGH